MDLALSATAAQVERFTRAWRRVDRATATEETAQHHLHRQLDVWVDDDGMVVLRGRLTPEVGAVVQLALEAAADRLREESAGADDADGLAQEVTGSQRRADALGLLAESALAQKLDRGAAGDRYQVVLHVEGDSLRANGTTGQAVLEDAGGSYVSAETSQRLACESSLVVMHHASDGTALDVGGKTRTIPPAIRRALAARDRQCRFPGCSAKHCDAHHLQHWADGGATRLDDLVFLCRRHHRAVHEDGFSVTCHADGELDVSAAGRHGDSDGPVAARMAKQGPGAAAHTNSLSARGRRHHDRRTNDDTALGWRALRPGLGTRRPERSRGNVASTLNAAGVQARPPDQTFGSVEAVFHELPRDLLPVGCSSTPT